MAVPLNRKEVLELIESIEAGGGDATELRRELEALDRDQHPPRRRTGWRVEEEELSTEDRLKKEVGDLFPYGITDELLAKLVAKGILCS